MSLKTYFPIYDKLTADQQARLEQFAVLQSVKKDTVIHNGSLDCIGFIIVKQGQLRSYMLSEEGREVTLYRLFDHDCCLFAASCMLPNVQFDVTIAAEKDSTFWVVPPMLWAQLMKESLPVANFANDLMATRFSEVMWLVEQIMWKSFDKRLAAFLLEESQLEGTQQLKITHEKIAAHMGTAREVVTRMLRYFQNEGLVNLTRGAVELTDPDGLEAITC